MEYGHRYHAYPTRTVAERLECHIDSSAKRAITPVTNTTTYGMTTIPKNGIRTPRTSPKWKEECLTFAEVHSKALQRTVTRFFQDLWNLITSKQKGHKVGILDWKSPKAFQSVTYSQSGFEPENTSGRTAILWLTEIGDLRIRCHRELPNDAAIKEITVKKESTGEWFVSFALDADGVIPQKPALDKLGVSNCVGIDLGFIN